MTGAFIVNRRAAILRVLLYLAITFALGFAAGRASASSPAAKAIPAAPIGRSESNTLTAERAAHSRFLLDAERSVPVILGDGAAQTDERGGRLRPVAGATPVARRSILRGTASWYAASGLIAAVHSWRWGNWPYTVRVCSSSQNLRARCIRVLVQDYCAGCTGSRLIDLSDDAFRLLAPLSRGVIRVVVHA